MSNLTALTALIINPSEKPRLTTIPDTLEALQQTVGGYIEALPLGDPHVACYVNEEGLLKGLPLNRVVNGRPIVGPILFVGFDPETSGNVSLTDEQVEHWATMFN